MRGFICLFPNMMRYESRLFLRITAFSTIRDRNLPALHACCIVMHFHLICYDEFSSGLWFPDLVVRKDCIHFSRSPTLRERTVSNSKVWHASRYSINCFSDVATLLQRCFAATLSMMRSRPANIKRAGHLSFAIGDCTSLSKATLACKRPTVA